MSVNNTNDEWDEDHALDSVLNDMINELRKVRVRFPNQPTYDIIENFDKEGFQIDKDMGEDLYGVYKGGYVMVNKEDYNNYL
jgi:DNA-binding winged helix-turn-helix (wHTH) protein